jgi:hypothetical protein
MRRVRIEKSRRGGERSWLEVLSLDPLAFAGMSGTRRVFHTSPKIEGLSQGR